MNKVEYLLYAYKKEIYLDNIWYLEMFSIHTENKEYKYIVIKDNIKYLKVDEHLLETSTLNDKPILNITDTIKLKKFDIPCLKEDVYTSIGIFIANILFPKCYLRKFQLIYYLLSLAAKYFYIW